MHLYRLPYWISIMTTEPISARLNPKQLSTHAGHSNLPIIILYSIALILLSIILTWLMAGILSTESNNFMPGHLPTILPSLLEPAVFPVSLLLSFNSMLSNLTPSTNYGMESVQARGPIEEDRLLSKVLWAILANPLHPLVVSLSQFMGGRIFICNNFLSLAID